MESVRYLVVTFNRVKVVVLLVVVIVVVAVVVVVVVLDVEVTENDLIFFDNFEF